MPDERARRTTRSIPTRERILSEVQQLIASKGVYGFTLRDVAAPLGVQVPAIYKHYADRDDVLIEVSRLFIQTLAQEFRIPAGGLERPARTLRRALDAFVDFHIANPGYVRLSLVDFATPGGGMEYVKRAAGGPFEVSVRSGPLTPMYERVREIIEAGHRAGSFRQVRALDFYRLIKASLLFHLVFPDDMLLKGNASPAQIRAVKRDLWDVAVRYLAPAVARRADTGRSTRRDKRVSE
jgi:AcrR family transcriptional regulator